MPVITFRDVILSNSKGICKCLIKKGMNAEQAMEVICEMISSVQANTNLSGIFLNKFGITDGCKIKSKNLLTELLNILITNDEYVQGLVNTLQASINNFSTQVGNLQDEKVKVTVDDDEAGYLSDKITSDQAGAITVEENGTLNFAGFAPLGACFMISKSRIGDFDNTGKGKTGTDVYGYAIRNGANGTINVLGKFARYAADITTAGNSGGNDTYKLLASDIPTIDIPITGTISDGLVDPVEQVIKVNTNKLSDGAGGGTTLVRFTPDLSSGASAMSLPDLNLKHSHGHNLKASRTNPSQTFVNLLPVHVLEIPIERIF